MFNLRKINTLMIQASSLVLDSLRSNWLAQHKNPAVFKAIADLMLDVSKQRQQFMLAYAKYQIEEPASEAANDLLKSELNKFAEALIRSTQSLNTLDESFPAGIAKTLEAHIRKLSASVDVEVKYEELSVDQQILNETLEKRRAKLFESSTHLISRDMDDIYAALKEAAGTAATLDVNELQKLNAGGNAEVYLWPYEGKNYAVRVQRAEEATGAQEAEINAMLRADANPRVLAGVSAGNIEIMELGLPLAAFSERQLPAIIKQLAETLQSFQKRGIAHRDLKIENLMRTASGSIAVIDFGEAELSESGLGNLQGGSHTELPPEHVIKDLHPAQSKHRAEKREVWALGLLIYHFYSGAYPYGGAAGHELMQLKEKIYRHGWKAADCQPGFKGGPYKFAFINDLTDLDADKKQKLDDLLVKALAPMPADRATFSQLLSMPFFEDAKLTIDPGLFVHEQAQLNHIRAGLSEEAAKAVSVDVSHMLELLVNRRKAHDKNSVLPVNLEQLRAELHDEVMKFEAERIYANSVHQRLVEEVRQISLANGANPADVPSYAKEAAAKPEMSELLKEFLDKIILGKLTPKDQATIDAFKASEQPSLRGLAVYAENCLNKKLKAMAVEVEAEKRIEPIIVTDGDFVAATAHEFKSMKPLMDKLVNGNFANPNSVQEIGRLREDLVLEWKTDEVIAAIKKGYGSGFGHGYTNPALAKFWAALGLQPGSEAGTVKPLDAIEHLFNIFDKGNAELGINQNPSKAALVLAVAAASSQLDANAKLNKELNVRYLVRLGHYYKQHGDAKATVSCFQKAYEVLKTIGGMRQVFLSPETHAIQEQRILQATYDLQKLLAKNCEAVVADDPTMASAYQKWIEINSALNHKLSFEMRAFLIKLKEMRVKELQVAQPEANTEKAMVCALAETDLINGIASSAPVVLEEFRKRLEAGKSMTPAEGKARAAFLDKVIALFATNTDPTSKAVDEALKAIKLAILAGDTTQDSFEKLLFNLAELAQSSDYEIISNRTLDNLAESNHFQTRLQAKHLITENSKAQDNLDIVIEHLFALVQQQDNPEYRLTAAKKLAEAYPGNKSKNSDEAARVQAVWKAYYDVLMNSEHTTAELNDAYLNVCDIYSRKTFGDGAGTSTISSQKNKIAILWRSVDLEEPVSMRHLLIQFRMAFASEQYANAEALMQRIMNEDSEVETPTALLIEKAKWALYKKDQATAIKILTTAKDRADDVDVEKAVIILARELYNSLRLEDINRLIKEENYIQLVNLVKLHQSSYGKTDLVKQVLIALTMQHENKEIATAACRQLCEDENLFAESKWQNLLTVLIAEPNVPADILEARIAIAEAYIFHTNATDLKVDTTFIFNELKKAARLVADFDDSELNSLELLSKAKISIANQDYDKAHVALLALKDKANFSKYAVTAHELFLSINDKLANAHPLDALQRKHEFGLCSEQDFYEFSKLYGDKLIDSPEQTQHFQNMYKAYVGSIATTFVAHTRSSISKMKLDDVLFARSITEKFPDSTVLPVIDDFNRMSRFVIQDILQHQTVEQRALCIGKWLDVAKVSLHEHSDYNVTMAISAGLRNSAVIRLKASFESVPSESRKFLETLDTLFKIDKSYKNYRAACRAEPYFYMPYWGCVLTDQTFLMEGNGAHFEGYDLKSKSPDAKSSAISRMEQLAAGLGNSLLFQSVQAVLEEQPQLADINVSVQKAFENSTVVDNFDNKTYQTSLALEPRGQEIPASTELANAKIVLAINLDSIKRVTVENGINARMKVTDQAKADAYLEDSLPKLQKLIAELEGDDIELKLAQLKEYSLTITALVQNLDAETSAVQYSKLTALEASLKRLLMIKTLLEKLEGESTIDKNLIILELAKYENYVNEHGVSAFIDNAASEILAKAIKEPRRDAREKALKIFDMIVDRSYEGQWPVQLGNVQRAMVDIAEIMDEKPWNMWGFGQNFTDQQAILLFNSQLPNSLLQAKERLVKLQGKITAAKAELEEQSLKLNSFMGANELKLILNDDAFAERVVEKRRDLLKQIEKQNEWLDKQQEQINDTQKSIASRKQAMYEEFCSKPALKRVKDFIRDSLGELADSVNRTNIESIRKNLERNIHKATSLFQSIPRDNLILEESKRHLFEKNAELISQIRQDLQLYIKQARERLEVLDEAIAATKRARSQSEVEHLDLAHTRARSQSMSDATSVRSSGLFSNTRSAETSLADVRFVASEDSLLKIEPTLVQNALPERVPVASDTVVSREAISQAIQSSQTNTIEKPLTFKENSRAFEPKIFSNKGNASILPYTHTKDGAYSFIASSSTAYEDRKATVEDMVKASVTSLQQCYVEGTKDEVKKACIWYLAHRKANDGKGPEVFVQDKKGDWIALTMKSMWSDYAEISNKARKLKQLPQTEMTPDSTLHISTPVLRPGASPASAA